MMSEKRPKTTNVIGVESEVRTFFQNDVDEKFQDRAACMLLAQLGDLYGCKDKHHTQSKTCPYNRPS